MLPEDRPVGGYCKSGGGTALIGPVLLPEERPVGGYCKLCCWAWKTQSNIVARGETRRRVLQDVQTLEWSVVGIRCQRRDP